MQAKIYLNKYHDSYDLFRQVHVTLISNDEVLGNLIFRNKDQLDDFLSSCKLQVELIIKDPVVDEVIDEDGKTKIKGRIPMGPESLYLKDNE